MKKFAISVVLASAIMSPQVWAEDLMDVFTLSLKSDPQLLAEAASRQAVEELDDQAKANFLPQINLTTNTNKTWLDASSQNFGGKSDYNSHGYALSLVQPVYRRENFVQKSQAGIAIEYHIPQCRFTRWAGIGNGPSRHHDDVLFEEAG